MSDPPPEACEVCNTAPLELVLYPVAVHYKGSGFYSTDYGKGNKRKGETTTSADGGKSGEGGGEKKSDAPSTTSEPKKAAEA